MAKQVTVYSTPTCPYCIRTKQFLKENDIAFEDIDVSAKPDQAEVMVEKSDQMGVPVIEIDGEIVVGFDKEELKRALGL
jgi:glutaredoxin-like YruB-family protein